MNTKLLLTALLVTSFSAGVAQNRDKTLHIAVTTATGENLSGQVVTLTQLDYALSYGHLTLDDKGTCQIKVYAGNHRLAVDRPGYEPAATDFVVGENDTEYSVSLLLEEMVREPFALTATPIHDAFTGRNSIALTWNTEPPAFFDDFETYEPFAVSFGEWTGIDADHEAAAPIVGDYPNRCVMQYAQIINPLSVSPPWWYDYPILRPYSGKQYVGFTRTSSGNANDDWLISPTVEVGNDHALIFMGKAADRFEERFQVYVTTNIDNPTQADFIRLDLGNYETADYTGWHRYQYDLSTYAGQQVKLAIRYISHYNLYGSFMLMVDDFYVGQPKGYDDTMAMAKARRTPYRSEENPNEVFHVFLDGNEVAVTADYACLLEDVDPGTHEVGVKAVYRVAESGLVSTSVVVPDAFSPLTFHVTAKSVLSPDGLEIKVTEMQTSKTYSVTLSDGTASIPSLPRGEYMVYIAEGAFNEIQHMVDVQNDTHVAISLTDRVITPNNITVDAEGEEGQNTMVVKWNQELGFNDSFEEYEDFATGTFGDWKSVDLDKMPVYPIGLGGYTNIVAFPGSGTANNPQPLPPIVFNPWNTEPPMLPTDAAVAAPDGDKTVAFFSPQRARADKWLISPQIEIHEGNVLEVTLKSYDVMYLESVEFCVSVEGDSPSDFTPISSAVNIPAGEWTRYQTDLSDYAGKQVRLAVHYISYDTFFLQLDDFKVMAPDGETVFVDYGNVMRYDIYLDNEKVTHTTSPMVTLSNIPDGHHVIGIVAVYLYEQSEMATISVNLTSGMESVALNGALPQEIYNIAGQKMTDSLSALPKGIYIVKSNNQYRKIRKQ